MVFPIVFDRKSFPLLFLVSQWQVFNGVEAQRECFLNAECQSKRCDRGQCLPKLAYGAPCILGSECISDSCNFLSRTCDECIEDLQCSTGRCNQNRRCDYSLQTTLQTPNELLSQMDRYTQLNAAIVPPAIIAFTNRLAPNDSDIITDDQEVGWTKTGSGFSDWEQNRRVQMRRVEFPNSEYDLVADDDTYGRYSLPEEASLAFLRSDMVFDFTDVLTFPNMEELDAVLQETRFDEANPPSYTSNFDMLSDESFSRIFFYGMGATILVQQTEISNDRYGPFVADMPIDSLPVRPGFRPLGCRVHFNDEQVVTAILDYHTNELLQPGDAGWDDAKFLARSSAFTLVTVREHLIWTHMIASNSLTKASILELPPSHPLARLLKVFTFRANEINTFARDTLLMKDANLHRTVGFTFEGLVQAFDVAYATSNIFEPFPTRSVNAKLVELSEQNKFPFLSEGIAYYNIVEAFVREWVANAGEEGRDTFAIAFYNSIRDDSIGQQYEIPEYSEKNMIDLLTQSIFTVTAYHELVGNIVDYTINAQRAAARVTELNGSQADFQTYVYFNVLTCSTSLPMPQLMGSFENWFGVPEGQAPAWERTVWDSFSARLEEQSSIVQSSDKERVARNVQHEFPYFDPSLFESSVSV